MRGGPVPYRVDVEVAELHELVLRDLLALLLVALVLPGSTLPLLASAVLQLGFLGLIEVVVVVQVQEFSSACSE